MSDTVTKQEFDTLQTQFKKSEVERLALDTVYGETIRKCHELRVQSFELAQRLQELNVENNSLKEALVKLKASENAVTAVLDNKAA